jgi:hypothetical protein
VAAVGWSVVRVCALALLLALALAGPAGASRYARYGIQDDAWLLSGAGTLDSRLDLLDRLGVDVVRFTVRWDRVAKRRPASARSHADRAYDWSYADPVLRGLRSRGIGAVVTLYGSPRWANGGRSPNWAPRSKYSLANFAYAAAKRYPWVRDWTIWNEPNQRRWLRPTSPRVYTQVLLNPAYVQLHRANPRVRVGGGVTAPRGNTGGVSPVAWIRGMRAAHARFDAYAHHPYPLRPRVETPRLGGCDRCETITMATLPRLLREVRRNFGAKRIWLTEYGYQTNPPDRLLGVSRPLQARYVGSAAHRAYAAPYVDMLVHFLVRDDSLRGGWQSGLFTSSGAAKPAYAAFRFPLAQESRRGTRTVLWGHVRPGAGSVPYRLRQFRDGRWHWVGGTVRTGPRGFLRRVVRAGAGARFQIWSPGDRGYGSVLVVT